MLRLCYNYITQTKRVIARRHRNMSVGVDCTLGHHHSITFNQAKVVATGAELLTLHLSSRNEVMMVNVYIYVGNIRNFVNVCVKSNLFSDPFVIVFVRSVCGLGTIRRLGSSAHVRLCISRVR